MQNDAPEQPDRKKPAGMANKPNPNRKPARKAPVKPTAKKSQMRRRHWGLILSFILLVALPFGASAGYLWMVAKDQYSSVSGFIVRQDETTGATALMGGIAQLTGSSVSADGDILYEFILSQEMVKRVDQTIGLREHYSQHWGSDPVFSIWPDASIEDLHWFWERIVKISYDQGSGLMEVRVLAFSPEKANAIATAIISESQKTVNALNTQAREDAMGYSIQDLEEAVERLKKARENLTAFRVRTQILDPQADIQGRMGVMNNLQQQLAESLISYDLLVGTTRADDPRIAQAKRQTEVIRERILKERQAFAEGDVESGTVGEDYPTLLAEYEGLIVDREFTEENYRAALTALDLARAKAQRQSRYLATFVQPTLPETAQFPQRFVISILIGLFLLLSWMILVLVVYSIRDRR